MSRNGITESGAHSQHVSQTGAFLGGDSVICRGGEAFQTVNPATEEVLATFVSARRSDVDRAVVSARKSFRSWGRMSPDDRKSRMFAFADAVAGMRRELATCDSLEMGMPIAMALEQVDDAAAFLRYNAELIDKTYGEVTNVDSEVMLSLSMPEARGIVGVITPWNFPLLTAVLAIAPALAAGNCVVLKPSEVAPSSALKLAAIAHEAGLPAGVFNAVPGTGKTTGAALAAHGDVDMLHFTGSQQTGLRLMVLSGQSNGKPVMLELGGKSPQLVFEDAVDIEGLGASIAANAFYNSGQVCVAKTRLIVEASVKDFVIERIMEETPSVFTIGDPPDEKVNFGPVASREQLGRVRSYVDIAEREGAAVRPVPVSGCRPESGFYVEPVLFDNARSQQRHAQEEIFGPALTVLSFETEQEAVRLANDVEYGLAAMAWTKDLGRGRRIARELSAGEVTIRASAREAAQSAALSLEPFGRSGHGILGGRRGLEAYQQVKGLQIITD